MSVYINADSCMYVFFCMLVFVHPLKPWTYVLLTFLTWLLKKAR